LYLGCEVPFVFLIFLLLLDFSVVSGEEKTEKQKKCPVSGVGRKDIMLDMA
jgi:hypothetical protein